MGVAIRRKLLGGSFSTANSFCGNELSPAAIFAEYPQKADNEGRGMGILHKTPEVEP
jgi:hypothetical protein